MTIAGAQESIRFAMELQTLSDLDRHDDVTAHLGKLAGELGFPHYKYVHRVPTGPQIAGAQTTGAQTSGTLPLNGYPSAWVERYLAGHYFDHDPVLARCRIQVTPVVWQDVVKEARLSREARRVMGEAAAFGLGHGLTVPVHGPTGTFGILCLARPEALPAADLQERILPFATALAGHLHEAVMRIQGDRPAEAQLSPRERECLTWAAEGKTSWEIATILNLTERTVNFHVANAMRKLEVTTRQQAVAVAVARRLINLQSFC